MYDGTFPTHRPKISEIQTVVAAMYGIGRNDLINASRKRAWAWPRQEAMYLARELTKCSYPQIGQRFGNRDHTTILYATRKIRRLAQTDEAMARRLDECRRQIAALVADRIASQAAAQGSSSEWTPPPPMVIAKPDTISAKFDVVAWQRLGGQLERAA